MSGRRNQNSGSSSGSGLKTAATFGFGALVGAIAAGAAWYMSSSEEESRPRQAHQYQANHPVNRQSAPTTAPNNDTSTDDEKDGSLKMCEICFVSFEELKECGVQIVATPCGHVYCRDCIIGSLNVKNECPHCRAAVAERDLRRLYL